MKKYFLLIFISFFILISILAISPKINNYLETKKIKQINNSIVKIIKSQNINLYQDDNWLNLKVISEKIKQDKIQWQWFFIDNNGTILTNQHIVNDRNWEYKIITNNKKIYKAQVIYIDSKKDLSILKINSTDYKWLQLNNSNIFLWETVYKLNNNSILKWIILNNNVSLDKTTNDILETNIKLEKWDSWSPLFLNNFYVIWINTAKSNNVNKNFVTKITKNEINNILKKLD
jgi:S1-C subfamily serine protease